MPSQVRPQKMLGYWLKVLISHREKSEEPAASLECQAVFAKIKHFVLALLETSKKNKQVAVNQSSNMLQP